MKIKFNCDQMLNWTFGTQSKIEERLKEIPKNTEHLNDDERIRVMYVRKTLRQNLELVEYYGFLLVNCIQPDSYEFEFDSDKDREFLTILKDF
jgi:hypothetical protein